MLRYDEEAGFSHHNPLIWDKVNIGMGYHFRCRHEFVVILDKGGASKYVRQMIFDIMNLKAKEV